MKATLIAIENDADHAQAKALVERLMASNDPGSIPKIAAQASLIEAYERNRWPKRASSLPDVLLYLLDQHGLSRTDQPCVSAGM